MKNFALLICLSLFFSCKNDSYQASHYFSEQEKDSLLTNIITYIYIKPTGANNQTKFSTQFRPFYIKSLPSFYLENYYQAPDGTSYFFVIRPVGGSPKFRRGVLGKFQLKEGSLMPTAFEEIVNTPHLDEEVVRERGRFLFRELVKEGNLDKYLTMKHYIEWPDSRLIYDKKVNEWVTR